MQANKYVRVSFTADKLYTKILFLSYFVYFSLDFQIILVSNVSSLTSVTQKCSIATKFISTIDSKTVFSSGGFKK